MQLYVRYMKVQRARAIAFASLGFLPWNFPRPRVFMGDVGSLALGFLLLERTIYP